MREEWRRETAVLTKSGSRETEARTAALAAWKKAKPAATGASSRRPRTPISNPTDTAHSTSVAAKNALVSPPPAAAPPARWGGIGFVVDSSWRTMSRTSAPLARLCPGHSHWARTLSSHWAVQTRKGVVIAAQLAVALINTAGPSCSPAKQLREAFEFERD